MRVVDAVHAIAGVFILGSLALGYWVHPAWFLFTAFVGLNLFQYGFTGFCPLALTLERAGMRR
ncbi:MAG: YgaP family membrane protein [Planctomycetota bacterium]